MLFGSMTGALEIPVYFFICISLDRVGRRYTMASCLLLASFISVANMATPPVSHSVCFMEWLWQFHGKTSSVFKCEDQFSHVDRRNR